MPELPEVETVVRALQKKIKGQTIEDVKIYLNKFLKDDLTPTEFRADIVGRKIDEVLRIGKNIIFELQDKVLISHLRMTGKWFVYAKNNFIDSVHNLAVFTLSNETILVFNDARKFGTFHYQPKTDYLEMNPIKKVALEPLNKKVDGAYLAQRMQGSSRHIKTLLLDQTLVAGIGNIYADEILFAAKVNPLVLGKNVTLSQYETITLEARRILTTAISFGGTTINSYQSEHGVDGRYQNELKVHTRVGQTCYDCGATIIKIRVNGRGTYYCPNCQQ